MKKLLFIFLLCCASQCDGAIKLALAPQVGLAYTTDWRFAGGLKFAETGRFSSAFMVTAKEWEYGISFSRSLTDKVPVFKSLSIGVYGVNFFEDFRVGGILSVDL